MDVAGFSAGAVAMPDPKLHFNTRLRRDLFAPNACHVFGRMASQKVIPAVLPNQTETYANVFGVTGSDICIWTIWVNPGKGIGRISR
ncbi:MAG: hypothetical protein HYT87_18630 [Nitrospirae bacterium]|nr:hypothetical protein [Nitrospirota bacterium]